MAFFEGALASKEVPAGTHVRALHLATHCSGHRMAPAMYNRITQVSLSYFAKPPQRKTNMEFAAARYPEDKKDPVVAEYMKTGALKACDEIETRFFGDGRAYVAGPDFTAAGGCQTCSACMQLLCACPVLVSHASEPRLPCCWAGAACLQSS